MNKVIINTQDLVLLIVVSLVIGATIGAMIIAVSLSRDNRKQIKKIEERKGFFS